MAVTPLGSIGYKSRVEVDDGSTGAAGAEAAGAEAAGEEVGDTAATVMDVESCTR